jgi:hypothetical protein
MASRIARILLATAAPAAIFAATPVLAQTADDLAAMRQQIAELKAEQQRAAARIAQLEAQVAVQPVAAQPVVSASSAPAAMQAASAPSNAPVMFQTAQYPPGAAAPVNPAGGSAPGPLPASVPSKLTVNGDLRVRYESNFGDPAARGRDRGVIRARLRAAYAVNPWLTIGGQIGTGDNDDPNSTDQTLGNFVDDLTVSLDQAYMRGTFGNLTLVAGKIPQPFVRTELVWDGDVNPQGLSAAYKLPLGGGASVKASGLYFLVDEATGGADSRMIGGQLQFETAASAPIKLELAAGYYDYRLSSLAGGDTGDFRTNRFAAGRYLSDYNLLDVVGAVQFNGLGEHWPVRIVGDYVHNFGATTDQDSGFGVDFLVGRGSKVHDWRFGYGYAETGVDAVLAAFSHDNTNLATNYRQHTLLVDYVVVPNVLLNATYYRYQAKSPLFTTAFSASEWVDRLRLNLLVNF